MPTRNLGFQSFYQAQLTSAITDTDLTIPLDVLPSSSEGILVIESTIAAKREIIYYTSKTASAVVCPSGAGSGRGYDGTTAVSHLQNSTVIMAPVAAMFEGLQDGTSMASTVTLDNVVANTLTVGGQTPTADWSVLASAPNTVTANGNGSYSMVFNTTNYTGTLNPGTRIRTTRTVAAPTQSTSLNGTTQYYNRVSASVAGMAFTDDFVVSAWVKLSSYTTGIIASRYNGTSGFALNVQSTGQVQLVGLNGGAVNYSYVQSYQSIPLNKWVHVSAQLDMSTFTATTTTSYVMINGVDVPATVVRTGTNPTALIQAGNLEIGSWNGGLLPFPGKISQVAIYNAKVTQATILASMHQGLVGTETSLISAYSFNGAITDLNTTNANNLTAQGSAVATNADSPFGTQASGLISSTLDYGIVQSATFSTNTTVVVQVPEGCTIPTSGGVAAVYYSSAKAPYGFPNSIDRWQIIMRSVFDNQIGGPAQNTYYNQGLQITVPIGGWDIDYSACFQMDDSVAAAWYGGTTLSTSTSTASDLDFSSYINGVGITLKSPLSRRKSLSLSALTVYYLLFRTESTTLDNIRILGSTSPTIIRATNAYL